MVTLEGIVLWNNQPDREAFGLVRKGVGQSTVLRAVETPYPKVNPIQSNPIYYACDHMTALKMKFSSAFRKRLWGVKIPTQVILKEDEGKSLKIEEEVSQ